MAICQYRSLHNGKELILVADQYRKNPFIRCLYSTTSAAVIKQMKRLFVERSVPEVNRNIQVRNLQVFQLISISSIHHYPRSNGFAERLVGICKKLLLKSQEAGTDCHLAMMSYSATPISTNLKSPAELNRRSVQHH